MTHQVKVALSVKNLQTGVNYIKPYEVLSDPSLPRNENEAVFTIRKLEEEVSNLSKKEKKTLKRLCQKTLTTSTSFFGLATPTLASANSPQLIGTEDLMGAGMWIIGIMAVAGFILAIVLLQSAAGYKMIFRKKKKVANEWSVEILKGFTQIMLAPALIVTIALVCYLLFGNLDWFVSPL